MFGNYWSPLSMGGYGVSGKTLPITLSPDPNCEARIYHELGFLEADTT